MGKKVKTKTKRSGKFIHFFFLFRSGDCIYTLPCEDPVTSLASNLTESDHFIYCGHSSGVVSCWDLENQIELSRTKIASKSIDGLQVFGKQCIVSDYSQIFVHDLHSGNFFLLFYFIFNTNFLISS